MKIISRTASDFGPGIDQWLLRSDKVDQVFRVCVSTPLGPLEAGAKVGAVYATDGDVTAGLLVGATRAMALGFDLPPLFTVSIGYPLDTPIPHLFLRNRDLCPWPIPKFDTMAKEMWGLPHVVPAGGSAAFAAFIADELKPLIEAEYAVDPAASTLMGVSLGGLFATWFLLTRPEVFQRYNIVSPALWPAERYILYMVRSAIAAGFAPRAKVYLSAGSLETKAHFLQFLATLSPAQRGPLETSFEMMGWPEIAPDTETLRGLLAQIPGPGFELHARIFEDETHQTSFLAALSQGLRTLYGTLA